MARPLAILFSLCLSLAALADGGVFLRVDTRANLPDQQAMIVYLNGLETLAIETRAKAAGEEIAWVVPLPAVPEVSPATTGTFPTLRAACAPRRMDVPWQLAASLGWLLMVVLCLFAPKGFERRSTFAACIFMLLFLCCLLVPTLGKARGGAAGDGVEVVDRSIVGNYEVSTINAATGDSIAAWLITNGFAIPADAKPALDDYTKEGWCFVACKLRRDDAGESLLTPHPLVFRFKTDRVVYPMRLTGAVNTGDLSLEIYVFANDEARVDGMETRFSQAVIGDRANFTINDPARAHPAIAALAQGATRLTMLRGTFTRDDMKRDITIDWRPPTDSHASVAGRQDAILLGVSIALAILIVACIVAKVLQVIGRASLVKRTLLASLVLATLAGGITYAATEKAPMVAGHKWWRTKLWVAESCTLTVAGDYSNGQPKPSLAEFRRQVRDMMPTVDPDALKQLQEEDSPGNYTIDEQDGEFWLTLHWPYGIRRHQLTGMPTTKK
ncbi:MAG: DUF2330 domain-containing protein [Phycisphaerales bacterium]|nr:DUF2330 domain-containing protein [Phycisphaerales bacterium]